MCLKYSFTPFECELNLATIIVKYGNYVLTIKQSIDGAIEYMMRILSSRIRVKKKQFKKYLKRLDKIVVENDKCRH